MLKSGDINGALGVMDDVVVAMPSTDPVRPLFALKRALIRLDSSDTALQEQGLHELTALAQDAANICSDAAQFYLGQYYWSIDQLDKAQTVWQQLVAQRRVEPGMSSPWAELASAKLTQPIA
jgi:hypothetical protein